MQAFVYAARLGSGAGVEKEATTVTTTRIGGKLAERIRNLEDAALLTLSF
jgi:hypothetical protein